MKLVIIAPHPDDEWIGAGCTMLKARDEGKKVKVLIVTRAKNTEFNRKRSAMLAKKYGITIKFLDIPTRNIDADMLAGILRKEIVRGDVAYIPDDDAHVDHQVISRVCQETLKNVKVIQCCVYNNSLNPLRKGLNKLLQIITGQAYPSFKKGTHDYKFSYRLEEKIKILKGYRVLSRPRGADVQRVLW